MRRLIFFRRAERAIKLLSPHLHSSPYLLSLRSTSAFAAVTSERARERSPERGRSDESRLLRDRQDGGGDGRAAARTGPPGHGLEPVARQAGAAGGARR